MQRLCIRIGGTEKRPCFAREESALRALTQLDLALGLGEWATPPRLGAQLQVAAPPTGEGLDQGVRCWTCAAHGNAQAGRHAWELAWLDLHTPSIHHWVGGSCSCTPSPRCPSSHPAASRVIIEKYYNRLTLDFDTNKRIAEEVAIIQSKRLRNKIAGFTTHLMKRIQKGPVRGISLKLQEEERERRMDFIPDESALNLDNLEVDADTFEMLKEIGMGALPGLTTVAKVSGCFY